MVKVADSVVEAISGSNIFWDAYARFTQRQSDIINRYIEEKFAAGEAFNPDQVAKDLAKELSLNTKRLKTIVRTETRHAYAVGRRQGFEISDPDGDGKYRWGGPPAHDPKTDPLCAWMMDKTKNGVDRETFDRLMEQAVDKFMGPNWEYREGVPHPNTRHYEMRVG
jgi:hypothetical protein